MSIRKVSFAPGEFYHLYNRGNSKQKIFRDKEDYYHFIKLMYISNDTRKFVVRDLSKYIFDKDKQKIRIVSIGAYTLMPNHFHLLVTTKTDGGISKFMQKLSTGYVMYYNKKYKRTGSLFEGKFKSQYLDTDRYLKYIFSYIHLNIVKLIDKEWKSTGIKDIKRVLDYLDSYDYSSYSDYVGKERKEAKIINTDDFPDYFPTKKSFFKEILIWLNYNN